MFFSSRSHAYENTTTLLLPQFNSPAIPLLEYKTVPLLEYKPDYINNTKYNSKITNENTYKIKKGQSYDNLFSSRYGNI